MECFDISNISSTHIVASMVQFRNGIPEKKNYRRYRITSTKTQDDFASMAEVVRRRYRRILAEAQETIGQTNEASQESISEQLQSHFKKIGKHSPLPDLIIVDGGKGQLSSACHELQQLGLSDIPIIGLAKEFEEIYRPGEAAPIRLGKNTGGLRLLQRIRDEAHRIANGYHELLLRKRISESALDDVPGISSAKKKLLLKTFGSLRRLRQASFEEIAAVKRIGPKLAALIKKI
jgi:excinuclease ABC subunit C